LFAVIGTAASKKTGRDEINGKNRAEKNVGENERDGHLGDSRKHWVWHGNNHVMAALPNVSVPCEGFR